MCLGSPRRWRCGHCHRWMSNLRFVVSFFRLLTLPSLRQQEDLMPACIKANAIQVLLRNLPTMSQPQTGSVDGGVLLATTARPCALSQLPTFPRSEAFLSALLFLLLCRRGYLSSLRTPIFRVSFPPLVSFPPFCWADRRT